MDAANLFVGDEDPTKSQFLRIKNVKIPSLEEMTTEHTGGGAMASVELGLGTMNALTLGFELQGFNPDVMNSFMNAGGGRKKYTVRGNIKNARTHADIELKAIIDGRMVKADFGQYEKSSPSDTTYEIKEIMFYQLMYAQQERFYFDYFAGPSGVRIDEIPIFQGRASNLGLQ